MTDRLRAGIVGAGFMGEVHARAVRAAGGVVARVAASTPERSAAAAERLGAEGFAESTEALLAADDVDVVHVCTPNTLHLPVAEQALAAGRPVVCEKPLATGNLPIVLSELGNSAGAVGAADMISDHVFSIP